MTLIAFLKSFLRQCANASAWLTGWMCLAERLAPGSILPYFDLYLWALLAMVLTLLAPRAERPPRWHAIAYLPDAFLLVAFLALTTSELGRWGYVLTAAGALLVASFVAAMAKPDDSG